MANAIHEDEVPFCLITGSADSFSGALVGLEDRCLIVKGTGFVGGVIAGSLGGARVTSFYYTEISGIEYNSGMINGVLEIVTPGYEASPTKDFWTGALNPNRNKSKNDPWTLSNTLPLAKHEYQEAKDLVDELRKRISKAKRTVVVEGGSSSSLSAADEILKLKELLDAGIIDAGEFAAAKAKLLN